VLLAWLPIALAGPACEQPQAGPWQGALASDLQPSRGSPAWQHRELMQELSAGRGASPIYRDPWTRAAVDLQLQAWGQDPLTTDRRTQDWLLDLSMLTAVMAAEHQLNAFVERSEALSSLQLATRSVLSPNLSLVQGHDGRTRLQPPQAPGSRYTRQAQARLSEGGRGPRRPSLQAGLGTYVTTDDGPLLGGDPGLAWSAYVQGERFGLDAFRVGVDMLRWGLDERPPELGMAWTLQARQHLHPRLMAGAELRSLDGELEPGLGRAFLQLQPMQSRPRWGVRSTWTVTSEGEQRGELQVAWYGRWLAPTRGPHPIGTRVGAQTPWYLDPPQRGESELGFVVCRSADGAPAVADRD
jgi:hypothetical protein